MHLKLYCISYTENLKNLKAWILDCGVVLLAELGDFEDDVHTAGDISEFRFVEEQTEEMELEILEKFKHCKYVTAASADLLLELFNGRCAVIRLFFCCSCFSAIASIDIRHWYSRLCLSLGACCSHLKERKGKEEYLYSAIYTVHSLKALRHISHSCICKIHHACLSFISLHQMAPP